MPEPRATRRRTNQRRRTTLAAALATALAGGALAAGVLLASSATTTTTAPPTAPPRSSTVPAASTTLGTATKSPKTSASVTPSASASASGSPSRQGAPAAPAPAATAGGLPKGTRFYNDPQSNINRWLAANKGDARASVIASKVGRKPQAVWFANYAPATVTADVRRVTSAAKAAHQVPVLVAYGMPNRDCGGASAGGAPDLASYDAWVRKFAAGLGSGRVVVILEPDALALVDCLSADQLNGRYASMSRAGAAIHAADPNARVYFDAGHSAWHPAAEQADRLRKAGAVKNSDGVYSNAANFQWTSDEVRYAKQVLSGLGSSRLHAVIDTSRNGSGPPAAGVWCDPPGRSLGRAPTVSTGDTKIDAFLWIKLPGEADGCAAAAGTFSPDYAFALAGG